MINLLLVISYLFILVLMYMLGMYCFDFAFNKGYRKGMEYGHTLGYNNCIKDLKNKINNK